jgi:hypothetical protein
MNLQVLVAVAEIVSALAVTSTLIALIISIRQNSKSQKALVVDSLAAAIASINVPAMESHALGSAISKATANWGSGSREERIMTHYFLFSFFKLSENAWYQQKAGILDKPLWLGWEALLRKSTTATVCVRYGGRVASTRIRQSFKGSFQEQSLRTSSAT